MLKDTKIEILMNVFQAKIIMKIKIKYLQFYLNQSGSNHSVKYNSALNIHTLKTCNAFQLMLSKGNLKSSSFTVYFKFKHKTDLKQTFAK